MENNYEVRVYKQEDKGTLKAFASVTINGAFAVNDLKVVEGKNGLFVSMPSKKVGEDYKDIFHPITKEARDELLEAVLEAYNKA